MWYNVYIELIKRELIMYYVMKNKTENTMTYYYNRTKDVFVNKMEFLLLNGDVDCIVVDDTLTAQEVDVVFGEIYGDAYVNA